jgi:adenylate kinase family enzyme
MDIIKGKLSKPQKVVIYGPEGVGKSTFASMFPEALFIDTEDSTVNMDVARLPKPSSWTMLREHVTYVKNNSNICKTLIIDTADWAERLCIEHICSKANVKGIEDFGYGKGYVYLEEEFGRLLNQLQEIIDIGINVVVTAHAEIKKIEQPEEIGGYDHWQMKLEKKTMPLLKEWADILLLANYKVYVVNVDNQGAQKGKNKAQGGTRVMYTTHSPWWDAKNRHGLPDELPFDYKKIAHIFKNQAPVTQTAPKEVQQATVTSPPTQQNKPIELPKETPKVNTPESLKDDYKGIPKALTDLLKANNVTVGEIQLIVAKRGYYPGNTPVTNYDPNFINGVLVGAWPQVYQMILDYRAENDIFTPVNDDEEIPRF